MRPSIVAVVVVTWFGACRPASDGAPTGSDPAATPTTLTELPDGAWALTHVDVVPMTDPAGAAPTVLADHTVVLAGDRIAAIVPSSTPLPSEVLQVDGQGRTVIPGLVDMHVHTWYEGENTLFVANGVTTIRNLFGDPLHLGWRDRIAAGDLLGPTIVSSGPIIDGQPPYWYGSDVVTDADDAARVVAAQRAAGYDWIKVYSLLGADAWRAVLAEADAAGLPVAGHVPYSVSYTDAIGSTQRTIEHLEGFYWDVAGPGGGANTWAELPALLAALPQADIDALAVATAEAGTYNAPTLVVYQKIVGTDVSDPWLDDPVMAWVHPDLRAYWQTAYAGFDPDYLVAMDAYADAMIRWTAALHAAGAPIVAGTDATNPWVVHGASLHEELGLLVQAGLSPYEALRAATVVAAEALGTEAEQGTIEVGKRADLVVLDEDPLADVAHTRGIDGVVLRGTWLDRAALDEALDALAAANAGARRTVGPQRPFCPPPDDPALRR